MKIAAIHISEAGGGEVASTGSVGPSGDAVSFASFLNDGAGGSIKTLSAMPSMETAQGQTPTKGDATTSESVMAGPATNSAGGPLVRSPSPDSSIDGKMKRHAVEGELPGIRPAKSKTAAPDTKVSTKSNPGDSTTAQTPIAEGPPLVVTHDTVRFVGVGAGGAAAEIPAVGFDTDDPAANGGMYEGITGAEEQGSPSREVPQRLGSIQAGTAESVLPLGQGVAEGRSVSMNDAMSQPPQSQSEVPEEANDIAVRGDARAEQARPAMVFRQGSSHMPVSQPVARAVLDGAPQDASRLETLTPEIDPGNFQLKKTNGLPPVADKSSILAEMSTTTLPVSDPSPGTANQHPFYASDASAGISFLTDAGRGITPASPAPEPISGTGAGKNDAREGSSPGAAHTFPAVHSSLADPGSAGAGGMQNFSPFDSNVLNGDVTSSRGSSSREELHRSSGSFEFTSADQFAMERLQTTGATRALGNALQSTLGLGVQTESFGRVTIHTATEGNHLLAELTLEDGRQSATLVSHVAGVEQTLAKQFGLEAAVNVTTGSQQSFGGNDTGDRGRDSPQQRQDALHVKANTESREPMAGLKITDASSLSTLARGLNSGRLDVTV